MSKSKTVSVLLAIFCIAFMSSCKCEKRTSCSGSACAPVIREESGSMFADDLSFLQKNTDVIVLRDGKAAVAVVPAYQGRVMTSTFDCDSGPSFGWLNRKVIEQGFLSAEERKGKLEDHIYILGGEERFWMGPEGGQFSIFFKPESKFDFAEWFTPPCMDTEAYAVKSKSEKEVVFEHTADLKNWSGTEMKVAITRAVRMLDKAVVEQRLGVKLGEGIELVAYETENTIRNAGEKEWTKESGMLSIWILGMYPPSAGTTVVIPFKSGEDAELGTKVNDTYFGKVPSEYLKVEDDILFFKGDGTHRAKIGISPKRSKRVAGSYDSTGGILNIVTYSQPAENIGYVNSMWELQDDPFSGDVINSYNDGSPAPGQPPLGPFYELETSSPAAGLKPGAELTHIQTTVHLRGPREAVDMVAQKVFEVDLDSIEKAL